MLAPNNWVFGHPSPVYSSVQPTTEARHVLGCGGMFNACSVARRRRFYLHGCRYDFAPLVHCTPRLLKPTNRSSSQKMCLTLFYTPYIKHILRRALKRAQLPPWAVDPNGNRRKLQASLLRLLYGLTDVCCSGKPFVSTAWSTTSRYKLLLMLWAGGGFELPQRAEEQTSSKRISSYGSSCSKVTPICALSTSQDPTPPGTRHLSSRCWTV